VYGTRRTKELAQAALTDSLAAHAKGEDIEPNKMTTAEWLQDWLELVRPGLKPGTVRSYHDIIEHRLTPWLGDVPLGKLRPAQISACYAKLREKGRRDGNGGLSETSLEHTHRCLRAALEAAAKSRMIPRNPADDIVKKPKRGQVEMCTWMPEQLKAFLDLTEPDRFHPLWVLAAMTGMRRGELLGLKWSDIDVKWDDKPIEDGRLSVLRNRVAVGYEVVEGTPKTPRSIRVIDLDSETIRILKKWKNGAQKGEQLAWGPGWTDSGYVFTREDGTPLHPHQVADAFEAAVLRSGLPVIRFHDLRHGWATMALRAGASPKIVSERLGHVSVGFTMTVYAHATPGWQKEEAEKVAGIVFGGQS
jgi:integrase